MKNFEQIIQFGRQREKDSGRYLLYCYGIYYGDNNSSIMYILSSMFYILLLDILTKIN